MEACRLKVSNKAMVFLYILMVIATRVILRMENVVALAFTRIVRATATKGIFALAHTMGGVSIATISRRLFTKESSVVARYLLLFLFINTKYNFSFTAEELIQTNLVRNLQGFSKMENL